MYKIIKKNSKTKCQSSLILYSLDEFYNLIVSTNINNYILYKIGKNKKETIIHQNIEN